MEFIKGPGHIPLEPGGNENGETTPPITCITYLLRIFYLQPLIQLGLLY